MLAKIREELREWEQNLGRGQDFNNVLSWVGNSKDRDSQRAEDQYQQLYKIGLHQLFISEHLGGQRRNWMQLWLKTALSTRRTINVMPSLMYSIGPLVLLEMLGSHEQQLAASELLLSGEQFCFGLSEPGVGTQLINIQTRAQPQTDGWALSGCKGPIGWSPRTTQFILLIKTGEDGPAGLSFAWINARDPAIALEYHFARGMSGQNFVTAQINSIKLTDSHWIGALGQGLEATLKVQQLIKYMSTAANMGGGHSLLRDVAQYAIASRHNRVLADYTYVRELLARATAALLLLEATALATAGLIAAKQSQFSLVSSVLKQTALDCSDTLVKLLRDILSVDGVLTRDPVYQRFNKILDDLSMVRYIDTNPVINLKNIASQLPTIHWQLQKLQDENLQQQLDKTIELLNLSKGYFSPETINLAVTNARGDMLCNSIHALLRRLENNKQHVTAFQLAQQLCNSYGQIWLQMEAIGLSQFANSAQSIELAESYSRVTSCAATLLFWFANLELNIPDSILAGAITHQLMSEPLASFHREELFLFLKKSLCEQKSISWLPISLYE